MNTTTTTIEHDLAAIVGPDHLRPATPADAVDGVPPRWVVAPGNAEEVTAVLRLADGAGLRVAPRGGGTKDGWGAPPRGVDLVLATGQLDQVLEHAWADMTATVQAGCPVAALQAVLGEHGQRLACDPLWPERATVGGILATNDSGPLRIRFGALRDLIIGCTVALPNGTLAKSGGKVVKNVAGYDLPKLLTGAFGTLGVLVEATFRLYPLPAGSRAFTVAAHTVAPLDTLLGHIRDSTLVPTGLQLRAGSDHDPAVDVRFESISAALDAQADHLRRVAAESHCAHGLRDAGPEVWRAHEALWAGGDNALICKVGVLPAQIRPLCSAIHSAAQHIGSPWRLVIQAFGVGLLRLDAPDPAAGRDMIDTLRTVLHGWGGSLIVLHCPPEWKAQMDVWGADGDALPLMRRVKAQFDPNAILNPGRFVGGI
jgi:glycolate oxidase FAD binding subunit